MMKRVMKLQVFMVAGVFLVFVMVSCNIFSSSGDPGPKLEGLPGKIIYSSGRGDETHLFITDREGTRQLTTSEGLKEKDYHAGAPSFSPNGEWVVYISNRETVYEKGIYMMRTDGSERTPLTDENGELILGENPVFSPDGEQIAFNRAEINEPFYYNNDIYVVELASENVRKLIENTAHDTNPTWSPDGSRIAFVSDREYFDADTLQFRMDMYVVNADGTNLKRLTESGTVGIPRWSSSGPHIAYTWRHANPGVYLLNLQSNNTTKLTDLKYVGMPMWNPDGTQLLIPGATFEKNRILRLISSTDAKLLKEVPMNFNGSNLSWYSK